MAQNSKKKKCDNECANCGVTDELNSVTLKSCGRCALVLYCSIRCQRRHWTAAGGHKANCVPKSSEERIPDSNRNAHESLSLSQIKEERSPCPVCLEPLPPTSEAIVAKLPCGHILRASCVEGLRSYGANQACPVCRAKLPPESKTLYEEAARRYFALFKRYQPKKNISATEQHEIDEILRLAKTAADLGNGQYCGQAKMLLGFIYLEGKGVRRNDNTAFEWYCRAAEQGLPKAQFKVASMHFEGKCGQSRDINEAAKWFHKAAMQGHESGQLNTAVIFYERGDFEGAVCWFHKAATQGNTEANFRLGDIYSQGRGPVQINKALAKSFYELAAKKDHVGAQRSLAILYHTGQGTSQNHAEAARWYHKAARHDAVAARGLGLLFASGYGVSQSDYEAARFWRMAAERGDAKAQHFLGIALWNGKGVMRRKPTEAVKWLREAAKQGLVDSVDALSNFGITKEETEEL